jgi:nudix-type nucleoside diphosphatase (YffH/AdpP family)
MSDFVRITGRTLLSANWGRLEKIAFALRRRDGQWQDQIREVYNRGNGAAVLLFDPNRRTVVMTRQFRMPVLVEGGDPMLIEVCAGLLDDDDPLTCARKEAEEESGFRVSEVEKVFDAYMSPGSVTEKLSFFVARYDPGSRVSEGGGLADEGEDIEVIEMGLDEALVMVREGRILDAKTIMLLQHVALTGPRP